MKGAPSTASFDAISSDNFTQSAQLLFPALSGSENVSASLVAHGTPALDSAAAGAKWGSSDVGTGSDAAGHPPLFSSEYGGGGRETYGVSRALPPQTLDSYQDSAAMLPSQEQLEFQQWEQPPQQQWEQLDGPQHQFQSQLEQNYAQNIEQPYEQSIEHLISHREPEHQPASSSGSRSLYQPAAAQQSQGMYEQQHPAYAPAPAVLAFDPTTALDPSTAPPRFGWSDAPVPATLDAPAPTATSFFSVAADATTSTGAHSAPPLFLAKRETAPSSTAFDGAGGAGLAGGGVWGGLVGAHARRKAAAGPVTGIIMGGGGGGVMSASDYFGAASLPVSGGPGSAQ